MSYAVHSTPDPGKILQAWLPFKQLVGVTVIRNEADYQKACSTLDVLLDEIGDDEEHPLMDVLDYLSDQVKRYEDGNVSIPASEPKAVLRFLLDQHSLKQADLKSCMPQSHISDVLNGKRAISKAEAKKLALYFQVSPEVFI